MRRCNGGEEVHPEGRTICPAEDFSHGIQCHQASVLLGARYLTQMTRMFTVYVLLVIAVQSSRAIVKAML